MHRYDQTQATTTGWKVLSGFSFSSKFMVQFNTVGDEPEKNQIIRNEESGGLNEKAGF